jgi:hypothetical protein
VFPLAMFLRQKHKRQRPATDIFVLSWATLGDPMQIEVILSVLCCCCRHFCLQTLPMYMSLSLLHWLANRLVEVWLQHRRRCKPAYILQGKWVGCQCCLPYLHLPTRAAWHKLGRSVASFCSQVAALALDMFFNFYVAKRHKIAYNSETTEAR